MTGTALQPAALILQQRDRLAFERELFNLLHRRLGLPVIDDELRISVANFTWEAFQNIREHAITDVFDRIMPGMHFLSVRSSDLNSRTDAQKYDVEPISPINTYISAIRQVVEDLHQGGRGAGSRPTPAFLVEITIADSGPGIPARMARTLGIYEGPPNSERRVLRRAIGTGTSKDAFTRVTGWAFQIWFERRPA